MRAKECAALAMTITMLAGYSAASGAPRSIKRTAAASEAAVPAALQSFVGVNCLINRFGARECAADDYELTGDPDLCPLDGYFGSVFSRGGVDLLDRVAGPEARVIAHLHDRQFVCIGTTADLKPSTPAWTYVIAVPTRAVPDCTGRPICQHADFPVRWVGRPPSPPCRLDVDGWYTRGCAAGWVRTRSLDLYSDGIRPSGE